MEVHIYFCELREHRLFFTSLNLFRKLSGSPVTTVHALIFSRQLISHL